MYFNVDDGGFNWGMLDFNQNNATTLPKRKPVAMIAKA